MHVRTPNDHHLKPMGRHARRGHPRIPGDRIERSGLGSPETERFSPPPVYVPLASSDGKCVVMFPAGGRPKTYFSKSKRSYGVDAAVIPVCGSRVLDW